MVKCYLLMDLFSKDNGIKVNKSKENYKNYKLQMKGNNLVPTLPINGAHMFQEE